MLSNEFIIVGLILINVIVFAIPYIFDFGKNSSLSSPVAFNMKGWNNAKDVKDGEYYRLLTAMFLHADPLHLIINMYSLWVAGGVVMSIFGPTSFAIIYLVSGIGGSLASALLNPRQISVGASGGVFGLIGAILLVGILTAQIGIIINILIIIALNIFIGVTSNSRIDNIGHMGGLVTGIVVSLLLAITTLFI